MTTPQTTAPDPEQAQRDFVERHLNRNIAVQLSHGLFGQTGFRLFSAPTFLPVYLYSISGSEVFVGLARSLEAVGQMLTPVIGASMIGHRRKLLGITISISLLMRLQILFIALVGFIFGANDLGIWLVALFMTLLGVFQGISVVTINSLRAKVIPIRRRGFVTGWRNFLSYGFTALLAYFAGSYFIDNNVLGNGYAAMFLLAFGVAMLGVVSLSFTREPVGETVRDRENVLQSIRAIPRLFRDNPYFGRFFVVSALGSMGRMAMPFYILYVATQMPLSGATLGALTTIWMLSGTATNVIWGGIADRNGYRIVMIVTLAMWTFAHVQLLMVDGIIGAMVFFTIFGVAFSGFNQARQNMVLEFGEDQDIPMRVAVANTATNAVGAIGPLLGGVISVVLGYEVIFIVCLVVQFIALVILMGAIPEPRTLLAARASARAPESG
ncbi:MAG: MFS transporter [Pseudomonadota bacterium]